MKRKRKLPSPHSRSGHPLPFLPSRAGPPLYLFVSFRFVLFHFLRSFVYSISLFLPSSQPVEPTCASSGSWIKTILTPLPLAPTTPAPSPITIRCPPSLSPPMSIPIHPSHQPTTPTKLLPPSMNPTRLFFASTMMIRWIDAGKLPYGMI